MRHLVRLKSLSLHSTNGSYPRHARIANVSLAARAKRDPTTNAITEYRTRVAFSVEDPSRAPTDTSSSTLNSSIAKLLLNSCVSNPHARLASIDVKDFYLHHDVRDAAFVRIRLSKLPPSIRTHLHLNHLPLTNVIIFAVNKALYGMREAGKISQMDCTALLAAHGYLETATSCLFKHTDPANHMRFGTIVDDFLIKYTTDAQLDHLIATLETKYPIKVKRDTTAFAGLTIDLQRHPTTPSKDRLTISVPNYVKNGLSKLRFTPTANPGSPSTYEPPTYGQATQLEEIDSSPPASAADKLYLQTAVGIFRWWADAVCPILLPTLSKLGTCQSSPTTKAMDHLHRTLNYLAHHPDSSITYHPSNMQLEAHSDASYLSEPKSRSRVACFFTCGTPTYHGIDAPYVINGAITIICAIIQHVVNSVAEAEIAGIYTTALEGTHLRQGLVDLGHPQNSTTIVYDNQVAGSLLSKTGKPRRSKMIAMRYHWVQDRIAAGEFTLVWRPGKVNLADFFTKIHPVHHFRAARQLYIKMPLNPVITSARPPSTTSRSATARVC
jgi:hypothetical protein